MGRRYAAPALYFMSAALSATLTAESCYAETPAGTVVTNIAHLTATTPDGGQAVDSNPVALTIAERLDVTLVRSGQGAVTVKDGGVAIPFVLTNTGNGNEAFALTATSADASVIVRTIAIDVDGDGRFDPAKDTPLADNRTAMLAAGATLSLLVVIDPATSPVTAPTLSFVASAVTGSGAPGTTFASQGDGGGDAVTGATGASARVDVPLGATTTAPTLVKSQSVRAPDGSASAVSDAIVTYSLAARFSGSATDARIDDPIPVGTSYVPGTLMLDGAPLSDAIDADAGELGNGGIAVRLGDIVAPATRPVTRTVTFQVKIK